MSKLIQQVEDAILAHRLLAREDLILAAVSGGVDSTVLLHVLHELAEKHKWRLIVAHLNHQLRGQSSNADQRLVEKTAKELKLPVVAEKVDVRGWAKAHKVSIEMGARELRHKFLARVAEEHGCKKIALAHHADDQVELFFMRLLRGAGMEGLSGMEWKSPSPVSRSLELVRPLLGLEKRELREFAELRGIRCREDASNGSLDFYRNRVRNELLPLLKKHYQPAASKVVGRLVEILRAENVWASEAAEAWLRAGERPAFDVLPVAMQRRCLQLQLQKLAIGTVEFDLIERLRVAGDVPTCVTDDLCLVRDSRGIVQVRKDIPIAFNVQQKEVDLFRKCGIVLFNGLEIVWERRERRVSSVPRRAQGHNREVLDSESIGTKIIVRHWKPGDRFQPIGMEQSVKLQDLFTNLKVPREKRYELVVASTADGEIFWVEGLRIGERAKVKPQTQCVVRWRWRRD